MHDVQYERPRPAIVAVSHPHDSNTPVILEPPTLNLDSPPFREGRVPQKHIWETELQWKKQNDQQSSDERCESLPATLFDVFRSRQFKWTI
jgi:hypothetical protein